MLILAGDVGGTSTRLAYFQAERGELTLVAEAHYPSRQHDSLADIVRIFAAANRFTPQCACLGVAGPIREGRVSTPNLPWQIEAAELAGLLGLPEVRLINDLEANTYGVALLKARDLATLNPGKPDPTGTIAVVSAGTGLGESLAYWDGSRHCPLPSEAGHADFAARNPLEGELLSYLQGKYGRASYERVVSGPGLLDLYRFLRDSRGLPEQQDLLSALDSGDAPAAITRAALDGSCPLCGQTLDLFIAVYGAEAGNAALRFLATGGVYLGGGIAPRIVERLKQAGFMSAFADKGRLSSLVKSIPVYVILNERTALLGAGRAACMQPQQSHE